MVLVIFISLSSIILILYLYLTRTFNYWKSRQVPGPQPVALFGNLKESTLRRQPITIVFKDIYEQFQNEKVVGVYRMTTPCLLLRDLDVIKHIMIKDFDVFANRGVEFSKKGLGQNLFHADGDVWRILRTKFTPLFTSGKLKNMLYLMNERADKFMNHVDGFECQEQEMHKLIQMYTMSTIAACAFGFDLDYDDEKFKVLEKIDKLIFTNSIFSEVDMMFPGLLKRLNSSLLPAVVTDFFNNLAQNVIEQRNGKPTNRNDFMDLILAMKNEGEIQGVKRQESDKDTSLVFTEDVIAAQAFVFYVAGYETSATTMAFMLFELAKNPDIQDKVIAELDEVLEKYNGKVTYEMINELDFMGKVFDETLRMYPIVDPVQRNAKVDYKIPGTDVTIRAGQTVLVSVMGIHYDEKYFTNPNKFDPERFSPEFVGNLHACAYMPFGVGPRNCIGLRFARVQSRVFMAKFLTKFRVECSKKTSIKIKFSGWRPILGPVDGLYLNIVKRKI